MAPRQQQCGFVSTVHSIGAFTGCKAFGNVQIALVVHVYVNAERILSSIPPDLVHIQ